jgi:hypothetical protein
MEPPPDVAERLDAIYDRLGRAEEHLDAIKGHLVSYYDSDPCEMSGEFHPNLNGGAGVADSTMSIGPLDSRLNTVIGEFLHNLRSSLDHLVWQLVEQNGGKPTGDTSFPILKVAPTPNRKGEKRPPYIAGGVSSEALAVIDWAQPYQWEERYTEHPLWLLNQLWNIDKHRHVIARGTYSKTTFVGDVPRFRFTARHDSTTEHGAKLLLVPDDPAVQVDAYTIFEVAIHEPHYGIETPLLRTLEDLRKAVLTLVKRAEDRCF